MYTQMNRVNDEFIAKLEHAINGEFSAISCYEKLAKLAPNKKIRDQILEIRNDELKHYHQFFQLYVSLTNKQPSPKISEPCPTDFVDGLHFAVQDELNTVDFYLELADEASSNQIKRIFKRAAADEQQHAVWFLYFLQQS